MGILKVGSAEIEITPDIPYDRGHNMKVGSKLGVFLDHLYASCVTIEDGDKTVILISCDLGMLKNEVAEEIRKRVQTNTGISREHIFVSATHSHQSPKFSSIRPAPWFEPDPAVAESAILKIVKSAETAYRHRQPAKMGYGNSRVNGCAFNRRFLMSDGKAVYAGAGRGDNPDRLLKEGPADSELRCLWFEDLQGDPLGVIVNFASHPAVLNNTNYVSSDYPGKMRKVIQAAYDKKFPVVFLQGASGNVATIDYEDPNPEQGVGLDAYHRIGRILGGKVIQIMSENYAAVQEDFDIGIGHSILHANYKEISEEAFINAEQAWNRLSIEDKIPSTLEEHRKLMVDFAIVQLYKAKQEYSYMDINIGLVRLGDVFLITNPVELFVEYWIEIKQKFQGNKLMMAELTNGYLGYVPTPQAFVLGGFETKLNVMSPLAQGTGKQIVKQSLELLNEEYKNMTPKAYRWGK